MLAFPFGEGVISVPSVDGTEMTDEVVVTKVTLAIIVCFERSNLNRSDLIHSACMRFPHSPKGKATFISFPV